MSCVFNFHLFDEVIVFFLIFDSLRANYSFPVVAKTDSSRSLSKRHQIKLYSKFQF